jgi:hypothetical protein
MTDVPVLLQQALQRHRHEGPKGAPIELSSGHVRRGDLRFVSSVDGPTAEVRLVLVLSVETNRACAEVILVHTATELACDVDGIVRSDQSSAPYAVVIETDLRGVVWSWQIAKAVGHVSEHVLETLGDVTSRRDSSGPSGEYVEIGLRLAGAADSRWAFKKDEGEAFRRLTRDCTEALLDDAVDPWVVDPGLLRPELLDLADDRAAVVSELMHWLRTRPVSLNPEDVERLLSLDVLDYDAWSHLGDLGADLWTALQELIERSATTGQDVASRAGRPWRLVSAKHLSATVWNPEPELTYRLGQESTVAA